MCGCPLNRDVGGRQVMRRMCVCVFVHGDVRVFGVAQGHNFINQVKKLESSST